MLDIQWITRPAASLWAGLAVQQTQSVPVPAESVPEDTIWQQWHQHWDQFLASHHVTDSELWLHLVPLAVQYDMPKPLVKALLAKVQGSEVPETVCQDWVRQIGFLQREHLSAFPNIAEELQLRAGPIRQLSEARLPGLCHTLGVISGAPELIPEFVKLAVVQPVQNGGSMAYPLYNTITWQGLLHEVDAELPEVVRLAWTIAQLNIELPLLCGELPSQRVLEISPWAIGPLVLAAAEYVELTSCSLPIWQRAAKLWRIPNCPGISNEQAATITWNWWQTFVSSRPPWPVALGALDVMLRAGE